MSRSNPMHHAYMSPKFSTAFSRLKAMGVPVYSHPDDIGNFSINAEAPESEAWVDYYNDPSREELVFGVHIDLERELQNRGLFAEWVNPGRLAVYEA